MATSATQQALQLRAARSRAALPSPATSNSALNDRAASSEPSTALRLTRSLAGQRNKNASLDKQIAGEAAARAGQVVGTYFGGVGGFVGKRIGRVLGENWRVVLLLLFLQVVAPLLFLAVGLFIILTTLQSFFGLV